MGNASLGRFANDVRARHVIDNMDAPVAIAIDNFHRRLRIREDGKPHVFDIAPSFRFAP
jgi:hypothetical protein